jgi:hypothetical protein
VLAVRVAQHYLPVVQVDKILCSQALLQLAVVVAVLTML